MCPRRFCKTCAGGNPDRSQKICAKDVRGHPKCAQIVRNLCGGAPAHFAQNIGWGFRECACTNFVQSFAEIWIFLWDQASCTGKKCLNPKNTLRSGRVRPQVCNFGVPSPLDSLEFSPVDVSLSCWAKTRVLKNRHARVETRVLKTLACRNGFWTSFKQW